MTDIIFKDALIIIDLLKIRILPLVLSIPFHFHTTDYIISEIIDEQQRLLLNMCIEMRAIKVLEANREEILEINNIFNNTRKLSFADSSIIFFGGKMGAIILTSDQKMRKEAEKKNIKVHGIFWIFQKLIEYTKVSKKDAIIKLKELMEINSYLSKQDCEKFLSEWIE